MQNEKNEECESTPEEIRPIYTRLLAEFQN